MSWGSNYFICRCGTQKTTKEKETQESKEKHGWCVERVGLCLWFCGCSNCAACWRRAACMLHKMHTLHGSCKGLCWGKHARAQKAAKEQKANDFKREGAKERTGHAAHSSCSAAKPRRSIGFQILGVVWACSSFFLQLVLQLDLGRNGVLRTTYLYLKPAKVQKCKSAETTEVRC